MSSLTWQEISQISASGKASQCFSVGDTKTYYINPAFNGTLEIVGFDHDDLSSGGKAGITFALKFASTAYRAGHINSSKTTYGGFSGSEMFQYLNENTVYPGFPDDMKLVIKEINKTTNVGGGSSTLETVQMKVFLFSEKEITGSANWSPDGEGVQYELFATSKSRIKKLDDDSGGAIEWWLRSPCSKSPWTNQWTHVNTDGTVNVDYPDEWKSIVFGFCV